DLARAAGGDVLFGDEIHHRTEHSIEFQAVWLRHVYGASSPPVLPVLCGSLHRSVEQKRSPRQDPGVRDFLDALVKLTKGKRVLVLAGADLGHVGPRFGDEPWAVDGPEVRTLEESDRRCMDAAARGDAEGFFSAI